jgi:glycosyltransferase involved in cell wall biosynthesis
MKIAVTFTASSESGGAFQYQLNILNILKGYKKHKIILITFDKDIYNKFKRDFEIIDFSRIWDKLKILKKRIKRARIKKTHFKQLSRNELENKWKEKRKNYKRGLIDKIFHKLVRLYLKSKKIDLIFWTSPHASSFKIDIPYIFTVYDLEHRRVPKFPEISAFGEYERREYLHENALKNAVAITTESKQGEKDVIKYYKIPKEKIFPLKLLPPNYLSNKLRTSFIKKTLKKYNLPKDYIYYPAQLWPHKNHLLIVKAIALLKKRSLNIHAVFSGSDKKEWGVLEEINQTSSKLGVSDLIHYIGYVSNEEINVLYKKSKALVMASQTGPSNIPYLEAFKLSVPVIAMDVPGIKDQVQNAGIIINPHDPHKLAISIQEILTNKPKVKKMVANGRRILDSWTEKDFKKQLLKIIDYTEKRLS